VGVDEQEKGLDGDMVGSEGGSSSSSRLGSGSSISDSMSTIGGMK
jgi:hypothetical protein